MMSLVGTPPSFNERAARMLERIEYRRATDDRDRDAIFKLRYDAYLRDGGIGPNPSERFSDAWDDVPNVDLIGLYLDGRLTASVRIHTSGPGSRDIPATGVFGDVLEPFFASGYRLVDATRFVVDNLHTAFTAEMPFLLSRAVTMAAEYFNAHGYLATVRREHALVYKRVSGHRALSEPRTYPMLNKPIVCMFAETSSLSSVYYARHPFARSSHEERERLFSRQLSTVSSLNTVREQMRAVA